MYPLFYVGGVVEHWTEGAFLKVCSCKGMTVEAINGLNLCHYGSCHVALDMM